MTRILYAAYGSNLHPVRLAARVPSARLLGAARISGRALRFHKRGQDGSGKCNIVATPGEVHAAIYQIDRPGMQHLHRIEGVGKGYDEIGLEVPEFGQCFTYAAAETHIDDSLLPFDWYRELVLAGCRYHEFPADYVERIRALPGVADPDRGRNARHRRLIERTNRAH